MNRRSHDLTQLRLVFIGDGAEFGAAWQRSRTPPILDFCHAVDHLADLWHQGTEQFVTQLQLWRLRLRQGGAAVIDELRRYATLIALTATSALNYLRAYELSAMPIGSGTVESACKHVVAARMKGSGMTWIWQGRSTCATPRVGVHAMPAWTLRNLPKCWPRHDCATEPVLIFRLTSRPTACRRFCPTAAASCPR